jgi:hypothetical protein
VGGKVINSIWKTPLFLIDIQPHHWLNFQSTITPEMAHCDL